VFIIFADTHRIIGNNIYENVLSVYDIELDKSQLLWGSVLPDILPQFKFHRHYQKESLNYIVNEIVKLIFLFRYIDFNDEMVPLKLQIVSKKIGIISHYLSDFVCFPHANRWTFKNSMFKHISYESKLNNYAPIHLFKKNVINVEDVDIFQYKIIKLRPLIKEYIEKVVKEYSEDMSFERDLDYSLSLSLKVTNFIFDTINAYDENTVKQFAFEF
jgi:hypothetical protein